MADASLQKAAADMHLPQDAARRDSITKLNATQSPLLRLPAEIRNAIYTFVFSDQIYKHGAQWDDYPSVICRAEHSCLGLLLASRQVYHEAALLPYTLATFVFDGRKPWFPGYAQIFLERRSEAQLTALSRMEVICCKKRWNGTGADFLNEVDSILSGNFLDEWPDAWFSR